MARLGGRGGRILGALSVACALLALACVAAQSNNAFTVSDHQRDLLMLGALALGWMAVGAGLPVVGDSGPGRTVTAAGLVITGAIAYRMFRIYVDSGQRS